MLKARYSPSGLDSARDEELERCLVEAAAWASIAAGHDLEQGSTWTERLDGSAAFRDTLFLSRRPVLYPTSFAITEDDVALTHAQGYDASADVIVANAGEYLPCRLHKPSGWSPGRQNVEVTYKYGWATASIPKQVEGLVLNAAWLIFTSPAWTGKAAMSVAGNAVTFEKGLSDASKATLRWLRAF